MTLAELKQRMPDGDPLVTFEDCCDIHESMIVAAINEHRAMQAAERKRGDRN